MIHVIWGYSSGVRMRLAKIHTLENHRQIRGNRVHGRGESDGMSGMMSQLVGEWMSEKSEKWVTEL